MIREKRGNLLHAEETIIAHQVNCFGIAGGLAGHIFRQWPDAGKDYHQVTNRMMQIGRQRDMLGTAQLTGQKGGKIIANLYGQYFPGADFRPDMLQSALRSLAAVARARGWSVAIPYGISCGICGGDWNVVRRIIEDSMDGVQVTLYRLE